MFSNEEVLKEYDSNFKKFGYHLNVVFGGSSPRFAYTIGCKNKFGFELVFAGGEYYFLNDVKTIFAKVINQLELNLNSVNLEIDLNELGTFSLNKVDITWSELLILGALDYYSTKNLPSMQIIPCNKFKTLDVPDLSVTYNHLQQPIWKYHTQDWVFPISKKSKAETSLNVLFGKTVTEVIRLEENEWQMLSDEDHEIQQVDIRLVPISILLAIDTTLEEVLDLKVLFAVRREDKNSVWNDWGKISEE